MAVECQRSSLVPKLRPMKTLFATILTLGLCLSAFGQIRLQDFTTNRDPATLLSIPTYVPIDYGFNNLRKMTKVLTGSGGVRPFRVLVMSDQASSPFPDVAYLRDNFGGFLGVAGALVQEAGNVEGQEKISGSGISQAVDSTTFPDSNGFYIITNGASLTFSR